MELHINESKKNPGALLYDHLTKESLYRITNSHKHTLVTRPKPIGGTEEEKVADIEWSILGTTQLISSIVGDGKPAPAKTIIESKRLGRYVCCFARNDILCSDSWMALFMQRL